VNEEQEEQEEQEEGMRMKVSDPRTYGDAILPDTPGAAKRRSDSPLKQISKVRKQNYRHCDEVRMCGHE